MIGCGGRESRVSLASSIFPSLGSLIVRPRPAGGGVREGDGRLQDEPQQVGQNHVFPASPESQHAGGHIHQSHLEHGPFS